MGFTKHADIPKKDAKVLSVEEARREAEELVKITGAKRPQK